MSPTTVQKAFFAALLVLVTAAFLWLIRGFLQPIFWAVALGIIVYPLHARVEQRLPHHRSLAAGTSMFLVVLIVILPLVGVVTAVTNEATTLVQRLNEEDIELNRLYDELEEHLPQLTNLLERFRIDPQGLETRLAEAGVAASRFIAARALALGQDTVRVTIYFFLMLYLLFFFLRDGPRLLDGLVRALPLGDARERYLLSRFAEVSRATIKGTIVVGIVQGAIGGTAFWILGLAAPVLWGVVMALLTILPAVGAALVWAPAAVILIVSGRIIAGIALILIGVLVIGLVDNLLRPVLVGRDTRMPDYLILLSTLGGLTAFGLAGIVIGPIIAAFFLSCWEMAREEFKGEEAPPAAPETAPGAQVARLPAAEKEQAASGAASTRPGRTQ
ncbi:MAG TPA: AI-2E family transporter [Gammaproteobacteria bacterium]